MTYAPPFGNGPPAVIIGCGDLALGSARLIGKRHPLVLTDIDTGRLQDAARMLRSEGFRLTDVVCDITSRDSVGALASGLADGIKALVHVAALAPSAMDWRLMMQVNLIGAFNTAELMLPLCVPGGVGVFVSSCAAYMARKTPEIDALLDAPLQTGLLDRLDETVDGGMDPTKAYLLSKHALNRACQKWAVQYGPEQVRVVSVSPGLILTAMGARERAHNPATRDIAGRTPLRREASTLEIAAIIDFAASDTASFLTGVDLLVDGGLTASLLFPPAA